MAFLIFIKTLSDMFYKLSVLDYLLMAVVSVLFLYGLKRIETIHAGDLLAFAFMGLLCMTMLRTGTGFSHFIKMMSAFMLYFIGRGFFRETFQSERALVAANYIVVLSNLALFLLGKGFTIWGSASTFRGMYFYKTDFSIAMVYAIAALVFFENPVMIVSAVEWCILAYLILRSNTRAALLIYCMIFGLWLLYRHERVTKKPIRINIKYMLFASVGLITAIYLIAMILSSSVFSSYHFITFRFNKLSDLFNTSNTQGRNVIWKALFEKYNSAGIVQKAIGIDFVSDYWNSFDAHNAYLKILFSTGFIGLLIFAGFIVYYVIRLNKLKDRSLFYYNVAILLTFMIQSMSQSSIDFTQMTWTFLYFAGCAVSISYKTETVRYHFNMDQTILSWLNRKIRFPFYETKAVDFRKKRI